MAGLVFDLIDVLEEQQKYYDELLILSEKKTVLIVNNDTEGLKEITSSENSVVGKIQKLEKSRIALVYDIANVINENPQNITKIGRAHV